MSTTTLTATFVAGKALAKAEQDYTSAVTKSVLAGDVERLSSGTQQEAAAAAGLDKSTIGYHIASLEILSKCEFSDGKPQFTCAPVEVFRLCMAVHKQRGASLSNVRKAITSLDSIDAAVREFRKELDKGIKAQLDADPELAEDRADKESSKASLNKQVASMVSKLAGITDLADLTPATIGALLTESKRLMALATA
jgi:hypothetical protein